MAPSIALHEYGHFLAMVKHDVPVEGYGVAFVGPLPLAAYVRPKDPPLKEPPDNGEILDIVSAGVINNFVYRNFMLGISVLVFLIGDPAYLDLTLVVAVFFAFIGLMDISFAVMNCLPVWGTDGDFYLSAVLMGWWGFDDALDELDFI
jgi:Zn-dependent protease